MTKIHCRAQLVADCQNDKEWDDERGPLEDDGTYIRSLTDGPGTIVCDFCYVAIMPFTPSGAALTHEIVEAIRVYRCNVAAVRAAKDPSALVAQAQAAIDGTSYDSPTRRSATACRALAQAEVDRREDEFRELMEEEPGC